MAARRYSCAYCGKERLRRDQVFRGYQGQSHYCRDWGACDRRHKRRVSAAAKSDNVRRAA